MKSLQAFAVAAALAVSPALADQPGALVVDVNGDIDPPVYAFDEVEIGTELVLQGNAEVTLAHYKTCSEITVRGGSVQIGRSGLGLQNTQVVAEMATDCAEQVALVQTDTASASVVMRNFGELPRVGLAPSIVVAGSAKGDFTRMTILRDNAEVARLAVSAGTVAWPSEGLYLSNGTKYMLVLSGADHVHRAEVIADRATRGRIVLRP